MKFYFGFFTFIYFFLLFSVNSAFGCVFGLYCPWYSFELNHTVPEEFQYQFEQMVTLVETDIYLSESSPLHKKFLFSSGSGKKYLSWISKNVKEIGYSVDSHDVYARVNPFWMPNYLIFSYKVRELDPMKLFAIFLHESMHLEGLPHTYCLKNLTSGVFERANGKALGAIRACDEDVKSSFGLTYIAMCNVKKFCDSCSQASKDEAHRVSLDALNRITSESTRSKLIEDCSILSP